MTNYADPLEDDNYHNCELSLLIDEKCSRKMTVMDIDCIQVKIPGRIRFIEAKHYNEKLKQSQILVFNNLKYLFDSMPKNGWIVEFYIVRGNYPFETAEVSVFGSDITYILSHDELIQWLNFELELSDIKKINYLMELLP